MFPGFLPEPSWGHQKLQGCYGCCVDHVLSSADLTRMIHILDTEHPWDVHSVNSEHSEAITCLEWDQSGEDGPGAGGPAWLRETVMFILDPESQGNVLSFPGHVPRIHSWDWKPQPVALWPRLFTFPTCTLVLGAPLCHSPASLLRGLLLWALDVLPVAAPAHGEGLPPTGSRLLSADADGQIKCWSMADHLANSWESHVGSLVEGDPIVALSWLHNGVKLALHVEKVGVLPEQVGAVGEIIHSACSPACSPAAPLPPPASFGFSSIGPNSCLQLSCHHLCLQ